jgi:RNA:NAD 2'-phosphotransferase (TPT1/KptA family)
MTKDLIRMSKFLSLVLRHKPEAAGVTLDENGWINISTLLAGCRANGHAISHEEFDQIVRENEKKRFTVEGQRVRAAQGTHEGAMGLTDQVAHAGGGRQQLVRGVGGELGQGRARSDRFHGSSV